MQRDFKKGDEVTLNRISNENLKCKDCMHRYDDKIIFGNTSKCERYPAKPSAVLSGKGCESYRKER